ncbi:hypothetical protein N0V86_007476 [Didymella sp. IMI 355093]|nr:hypothetical protein N0V86_007476 [Didymella sp. IMI 355093]
MLLGPQSREPTPFTSALRGLSSAVNEDVLNLAATLTTQVGGDDDDNDDDAAAMSDMDEAHASVPRHSSVHSRDQQRLEESRIRLRQLERTRDDLDHRDRLRRSMDRLNRLHEASAQTQYAQQERSNVPAYDNWAPLPSDVATDSLRSTAMLQAVRRHPRFSARTREYLQRYDRERDRERRSTQDPRERYQRSAQPPPTVAPMLEHTVKYLSRIRHASTVDESLHCALDAGFLSNDYFCIQYADFLTDTLHIPPPHETSWLAPGAVLSGCQHATTSTSTSTSMSTSTPTPGLAASQLPPPSRPWLSTSYSTPRSLTSYLSPNAPSRTEPPQPPPPHHDRWPVKVTIHAVDWSAMSLSATMEAYNVPSHPHQHSLSTLTSNSAPYTRTSSITTYLEGEILDFNSHTLLTESFKSSAANDALYWRKLPPFRDMEDEDVVRALTSRRWWEGLSREWVLMRWKERCFVKSLRTGSKTSSLSPTPAPPDDFTDAARSAGEQEYYIYDSHTFARHAAPPPTAEGPGPHWVDAEHAAFDDSGCGLTISGFYYVCLRRDDGRVEGLYYDPMSSPYQCLMLESQPTGRFASWQFA